MTKYYVDFGGYTDLVSAYNPYQACLYIFKKYLEQYAEQYSEEQYAKPYTETLPASFRVSQQGFDIHDTDEIIPTYVIIHLQLLNNN